jgi:hypothetical protein
LEAGAGMLCKPLLLRSLPVAPPRICMVQNYTVVQARTMPELIAKVNALIALGWQPQGSIAIDPISHIYLQAMWTELK